MVFGMSWDVWDAEALGQTFCELDVVRVWGARAFTGLPALATTNSCSFATLRCGSAASGWNRLAFVDFNGLLFERSRFVSPCLFFMQRNRQEYYVGRQVQIRTLRGLTSHKMV